MECKIPEVKGTCLKQGFLQGDIQIECPEYHISIKLKKSISSPPTYSKATGKLFMNEEVRKKMEIFCVD